MATELLYIDLFCGAGGTSTGVERAHLDGRKCARVIARVNHDANAILSHAANHPHTRHFTEDIRTLDLGPLKVHTTAERMKNPDAKVVLWASLECTNHSRAKGGMSRDADSRTLAEHLFRCIEELQPDYIQIENVVEFMEWGPLRVKVVRSAGRSISYEATGSVFKPLSSDANTLDGKNASCTIVDEFHAHKTDEVYAVMMSSMDARRCCASSRPPVSTSQASDIWIADDVWCACRSETPVESLAGQYDIRKIGYDRWNSSQLVIDLLNDGLPMDGFQQSISNISPPTKEFERLARSGDLEHYGNPILRWMVSNVVVYRDANDNLKPVKNRSPEKIDGVVAAIEAIGEWMSAQRTPPARSIYEERGLRTF